MAARPGPQTSRSGPARVLVAGDSLAFQIGFDTGLTTSNVAIFNGAMPGCGITGDPPMTPWMGGGTMAPQSACGAWAQQYRWAVAGWHPDAVVFLSGYWESQPQLFDGVMADMANSPAYARAVGATLAQVLGILHSQGAPVLAATAPYFGDGTPPDLVDAYNATLEQVSAGLGWVQLFDLNGLIDPSGQYDPVVDGITVRTPDGVHLTSAGVEQVIDPGPAAGGLGPGRRPVTGPAPEPPAPSPRPSPSRRPNAPRRRRTLRVTSSGGGPGGRGRRRRLSSLHGRAALRRGRSGPRSPAHRPR